MSNQQTSKYRVPDSMIVRNIEEEKELGIQDLKFYLYDDGYALHIKGQIIGKRLLKSICFQFTAYDQDGDVIFSSNNSSYGGTGFVTSTIYRENFFNGFPFSCYFNDERWKEVKKIKVQVLEVEDE